MKKLIVFFMMMSLMTGIFAADPPKSSATLNINGYKKSLLDEEAPAGAEVQSKVEIRIFDNISNQENPLAPIGRDGAQTGVPVDKYVDSLFMTPLSVATFQISGRIAPNNTAFWQSGGTLSERDYKKTEDYRITVTAEDHLHYVPQPSNQDLFIPCTVSVERFSMTLNGVECTLGKEMGQGDGRPVLIGKKNRTVSMSESFVTYTDESLSGNEIFKMKASLRNYTAYAEDGKVYTKKNQPGYYDSQKKTRVDRPSHEWEVSGRIKLILGNRARPYTHKEYDLLPPGVYQVPVTLKVEAL